MLQVTMSIGHDQVSKYEEEGLPISFPQNSRDNKYCPGRGSITSSRSVTIGHLLSLCSPGSDDSWTYSGSGSFRTESVKSKVSTPAPEPDSPLPVMPGGKRPDPALVASRDWKASGWTGSGGKNLFVKPIENTLPEPSMPPRKRQKTGKKKEELQVRRAAKKEKKIADTAAWREQQGEESGDSDE